MPTYEYACRDCGERLEVVQSFTSEPLTICPNCQGALRKVFSAAGIVFKGSGWHSKDYARSGARSNSSSDDSGSSDTSTSATKDTKGSGDTGKDKPKTESFTSETGNVRLTDKPTTSKNGTESAA